MASSDIKWVVGPEHRPKKFAPCDDALTFQGLALLTFARTYRWQIG